MTWAKLDDRVHGNPKMLRVWHTRRTAVALWLFGLTYAAQHNTDGLVHEWFVLSILPLSRDRDADTGALVDAGLWDTHPEGWCIPDFLDYNPSRAEVEARKAADAERKARGRASRRNPSGVRTESERTPAGIREESARPDPTRPQTPPIAPRKRGANKGVCGEEPVTEWARAHLTALEGGDAA